MLGLDHQIKIGTIALRLFGKQGGKRGARGTDRFAKGEVCSGPSLDHAGCINQRRPQLVGVCLLGRIGETHNTRGNQAPDTSG